nr:immunoglobulin light chain junction region [Macaca mulatta]
DYYCCSYRSGSIWVF